MKSIKGLKPLALILGTGLVVLPPVSQAEGNWYVGASAGQSDIDERGIDDDDTSFKVFGGYNFNRYFALEGAFVDFGELEDRGVGGIKNELDVDGFSFGAVGTYPISEKFSVHGKAGIYAWDLDANGAIAARFDDDDDTDPFYGVGVSYHFTKNYSVVGEWERYEIDDFDVDFVSVGFSYNF